MMKFKIIYMLLLAFVSTGLFAQLPPTFSAVRPYQKDAQIRQFLAPVKILWKSESGVKNENKLLQIGNGQADLNSGGLCTLNSFEGKKPSILLDFGKELHGGLQLVTGMWAGKKPIKLRIRFGESASEAMSD
ncbi:MAG TPA: alpha-L-rhamnosidase, partial [Pelobium sp.]|nr:alpha-L-rhamnosidase [Pelobium sp.]